MQQMLMARLLVWWVVLGGAIATADMGRALAVGEPDLAEVAGLDVAIWRPSGAPGPYPLVLFSHGAGGCKDQSTYLLRELAQEGMLVVAPDHTDKGAKCPAGPPQSADLPPDLLDDGKWGPSFHDDRGDDLHRLRAALEADPAYSGLIDPTRVALVGHSLGGYTVLALAGAWPSWKMNGVAAVVALAPFSQPFVRGGEPSGIKVPVLFQVGSEDQLTPEEVTYPIFAATGGEACMVVYPGADHFAWTDLRPQFHGATASAIGAFLNEAFSRRPPTKAILASPLAEDPQCK